MPAKPKIRIAIDCRITDPRQGIGTAVMVFASALSRSLDVGQEYTFVVPEALKNWLAPHISGPCRLQTVPPPQLTAVKAFLRELPLLRRIWSKLRSAQPLPSSDGYVESAGFDVVHFPTQAAYLTGLPSIYQPWDLQHLHYPEFFKKEDWIWRDKLYRAFCKNAAYVCVQTKWTKQDLIAQYELAEDKVVVIPWGSVFEAYALPSLDLQEMTAFLTSSSFIRRLPGRTKIMKSFLELYRSYEQNISESQRYTSPGLRPLSGSSWMSLRPNWVFLNRFTFWDLFRPRNFKPSLRWQQQ